MVTVILRNRGTILLLQHRSRIARLESQDEPTILVTHSPPKSDGEIDYVQGAGHVGDGKLAEILNKKYHNNVTNVHGHIHERGNTSARYAAGNAINVASITDVMNPLHPGNTIQLDVYKKDVKASIMR